ncbi:MAG: hypothetical protein AAGG48_30595 [Planctomycetota bacterium]
MRSHLASFAKSVPKSQWLKAIESVVFLSELADRIDATLAQKVFAKAILEGKFRKEDADKTWIRGDWSQLLDTLTEGMSDFVDALFVALGSGRKPSASHVLLSAISRAFGSRLALTTNFDSLFEKAAIESGFEPQVFDVSTHASVPHPILVRPNFSVVKLHGSNFGLRVGERLQSALDDDTKNKILGYLDPESLVIVLGFSGWERRMMQLLEAWATTSADEVTDHKERIVWLHFEESPTPCIQMMERLKSRDVDPEAAVKRARIQDAETFLASCYYRFSSAFPASSTGYEYLSPARISNNKTSSELREETVVVFSDSRLDLFFQKHSPSAYQTQRYENKVQKTWEKYNSLDFAKDSLDTLHVATNSSVRMAAFSAGFRSSHMTIWIDLEPHHTVQGVVCEILDRMRIFDPELPTIHFPSSAFLDPKESNDEIEAEFAKARERIIEAMTRRSYVLCFDRLEGFARPQTVHHGTPSGPENDPRESEQLELLCNFLFDLCKDYQAKDATGNGRFAFSIDVPRSRHHPPDFKKSSRSRIWERSFQQVSSFYGRITGLASKSCNDSEKVIDQQTPRTEASEKLLRIENVGSGAELANNLVNPPSLFQTTWKLAHSPLTDESPLKPTDSFSVLSLLRRPRSIVTIRSVLGTHINKTPDSILGEDEQYLRKTFSQIDDVVGLLAETGLAYCLEGETVWLPSLLHEQVYKYLTETLKDRSIAKKLSQSDSQLKRSDPINELFELLTLVYWHRRFARHFYSGVYLPTKDPNALWEYCYHRVSSLRYLASAHALCVRFSQCDPKFVVGGIPHQSEMFSPKPGENTEEAWAAHLTTRLRFLRVIPNVDDFIWLSVSVDGWKKIAGLIGQSRVRQIDAMRETLSREREYLFSVVPPETLAGWCRQIRDRDIDAISGKRLNNLTKNFDLEPFLFSGSDVENGFRPSSVSRSVQSFANELTQLISVVTFLRRDFQRSHAVVWNSKEKVGPEVITGVIRAVAGKVPQEVVEKPIAVDKFYEGIELATSIACKNLNDEEVSEIAAGIIDTAWKDAGVESWFRCETEKPLDSFAESISRIVSALRRSAISKSQLGAGAFAELLLNASDRLADASLSFLESKAEVSEDTSLTEGTAKLSREKLSNVRRRIDLLLVRLPLWGAFDAMKKHRPNFRYAYAQDKLDLAEIESRRLEDLARESQAISPDDYFEYRCDSLMTFARVESLKSHFINCHRLLDRATAGLTDSPRHQVFHAKTSMYRAEACAMSAATALSDVRRLNRASRASIRDRVSHARDLLRRADEALLRSENSLAGGRRDLSAWIDLFLGRGQILFEMILVEVSCFDTIDAWDADWSHDQFTARIERLMDQALVALRSALDTIPYRRQVTFREALSEPQHQRELKALALWTELLVVGDFVLRLGRVKAASHEFPGSSSEETPKQWAANFGRLNKDFSRKDELIRYFEFFAELCKSARFGEFAMVLRPIDGMPDSKLTGLVNSCRLLITGETVYSTEELLRVEFLKKVEDVVEYLLPKLWSIRHSTA